MIYLIYGNDEIKSRAKYNALADSLLAKNPEASLFKLTSENFTVGALEELTKGQGLFYQKFIVGCDNLFSGAKENEALANEVGSWLDQIAQSDNVFIFLENNPNEIWLADLKKVSQKAQEFSKREAVVGKGFNIFSIIDAFASRNKNRAWALYEEALMSGFSAVEVLWKLIWQVNNLLLVKNTKDNSRLKIKPFVLTKTKAAAKTFSSKELKNLSASFLDLYHTTFLGTDEFEFGLEKILLSI